MADLNPGELWEPYMRRDPVTGRVHMAYRIRHGRLRSERLEHFRQCVGEELRGRTFRGRGASQDQRAVRDALTAAAHRCAARSPR